MIGSRSRSLTAMAVAAALLVAGCSYEGAQSLPLPGAIGGDGTYPVTVVLPDATNLVPKETCRTNDTVVGSVESVELNEELQAVVVCRIKDSVKLPGNAIGNLRDTSLLGERFIALDPPPGIDAKGVLPPDSTLPIARTRSDPNVELVLGALSQVLNGGSLGKIQSITNELNLALQGSDVGSTINQLSSVVGKLTDNRSAIVDSLEAVNELSGDLASQREVIAEALGSIPDGLKVLERQRPRLVKVLRKLDRLSDTAVPLIRRSKANTVADLKLLAPVLSRLTEAGDQLALTLERVASFPFSSNALSTIKGDYGGLYGTIVLDLDMLNGLLGGPAVPGADDQPANPDRQAPEAPEQPSGVPDLPVVPEPSELLDLLGLTNAEDGLGLGGLLGGGS